MYRYRPCQISRLNHCHIWVIAITANVELKGNKFIPISSDSVDKKKLGGRKPRIVGSMFASSDDDAPNEESFGRAAPSSTTTEAG